MTSLWSSSEGPRRPVPMFSYSSPDSFCLPRLLNACAEHYKRYDSSHGFDHALEVMKNLFLILENGYADTRDEEFEILVAAALVHDLFDHKYQNTENNCLDVLTHCGSPEQQNMVMGICQNISWSKEQAGKNKPLTAPREWMRLTIQDADWLDALGERGLQRCIDYTTKKLKITDPKAVSEHVCKHIREKLLLIPKKLNYPVSRDLAELKTSVLLKYLHDNEE